MIPLVTSNILDAVVCRRQQTQFYSILEHPGECCQEFTPKGWSLQHAAYLELQLWSLKVTVQKLSVTT